jgi:hypothetical protein
MKKLGIFRRRRGKVLVPWKGRKVDMESEIFN